MDDKPEFREQLLDKIKESEARQLGSEERLLAELSHADKVFDEIEDQLAKQWKGKQGRNKDVLLSC